MKKVNWWIVGCVAFALLFLGKSCSSCRNQRTYEMSKTKTELVVSQTDSLYKAEQAKVMMLEDSIKILNTKIEGLKEQSEMLKGSNDQLLKTNHNLSKKNTIE